MRYPFASLPGNLAAFCAFLRRERGFRIGPGELHDAARALDVVDLRDEQQVRHALRPILSGTAADAQGFDAAFAAFFHPRARHAEHDRVQALRREPGAGTDGPRVDHYTPRHAPGHDAEVVDEVAETRGPMAASDTSDTGRDAASLVAPSSYSPLAVASQASPEVPRLDPLWRDAARTLVRRVQLGLGRRWRPAPRGRRLDLRRTLRASLQTGGEPVAARWLRRPRRAPRFVLLVDGSRSMSDEARPALQLGVALVGATPRAEIFTFSTALERVTDDLRRAAAGERRQLDHLHEAWAGGTSIGACLRDFLRRFGGRLGPETLVLIASDGLDVGDVATLEAAMSELRRRSAGVVWLNPLLETAGYEPTASGMRAARRYVSTFTSVSDAAGLGRLARRLRLRA